MSARKLALTALAASALLLPLAPAALASPIVDNLGTDGVLIPGSALVTLVAGTDAPGAISARFAGSGSTLFCCRDTGLDSFNAGYFVIHAGGTTYNGAWGVPFVQTSPPGRSGSGSLANPWIVTSAYRAGTLAVVQRVRAVDGSHNLRLSFTVTNGDASAQQLSAFWSADLYVSGSDQGKGAFVAGPPRQVVGVAQDGPGGVDGTKVRLTEITPWSHYYEGYWVTAVGPTYLDPFTYDDTTDPARLDNGFGAEWDDYATTGLAPGASVTFEIALGTVSPGGSPVPGVAPDITSAPADPSPAAQVAVVGFAAHAGDTASAAFECSLDGGAYDVCTSPVTYTGLAAGAHTVAVHGVSVDGDAGPAATTTWTAVVAPPAAPTISARPADPTSATAASIAFSGGTLRDSFACSLDGGAFAPCTSPFAASGLGAGGHTFRVHLIDASANAGPDATATWTVDATPPAAPTIVAAPDDPTAATDAVIEFAGEPAATFSCRLDGGSAHACTSPASYRGLARGAHAFAVRQVDLAANASAEATATWTIASTPAPVSPPATAAAIAVEHVAVVESHRALAVGCRLDSGRVARCTVTLVGAHGVVLGRAVRRFTGTGAHRRVAVHVTLTRRGWLLANRVGGVAAVVRIAVTPVGATRPLTATAHVRLVAPRVLVAPTDLTFRSASTTLSDAGLAYLRHLAASLAAARSVRCEGHTDSVGGDAANDALGLARARVVCRVLAAGTRLRVQAVSFGERRPRAVNGTAAGRAQNRRVEVRIGY